MPVELPKMSGAVFANKTRFRPGDSRHGLSSTKGHLGSDEGHQTKSFILKTFNSRTLVWLSSCINSMLYLCKGGFKKRLKESMKQKLARVSRSEAENRNSTIPTARETLLDNTVTNGSRANSLRFVKLGSK